MFALIRQALLGMTLLLMACGDGRFVSKRTSEQPSDVYYGFVGEEAVSIAGHHDHAMEPFISPDGLILFFNNSNAPNTNTDIFWSSRQDDGSFKKRGPLMNANSAMLDGVPSMDRSGQFYFISVRDYESSLSTVYHANFNNGKLSEPKLVKGASLARRGIVTFDAEISGDGNSLWLVDGHFSGGSVPDSAAIAIAQRQGDYFVRREDSVQILAKVNEGGLNFAPAISSNGLELFFTRVSFAGDRRPVIMRAERLAVNFPFGKPQRVDGISGYAEAPSLSSDGQTLFYHKLVGNRFVIHRVTRNSP